MKPNPFVAAAMIISGVTVLALVLMILALALELITVAHARSTTTLSVVTPNGGPTATAGVKLLLIEHLLQTLPDEDRARLVLLLTTERDAPSA